MSLLRSIPPTTANKQSQAQEGSMARKLLGANAKSYRLKLKLKLSRLVSTSTDCPPASTGWQPPSTALGPTPASASLGGGPAVAGALVPLDVVCMHYYILLLSSSK